jgi:WD40 repeat protein
MAAFDPSGTRVASAGLDHTVRVVDVATFREVTPVMWHTGRVNVVRFSADGSKLLTVSEDRTACLWDSRTGQQLGAPLGHGENVIDVRFSADARRVVTATASAVTLWDGDPQLASREPLVTWHDAASGRVCSIDFARDGQTVVIGCYNGQLWCWDVAQGGQARKLIKHQAPIWACRISPDGTRVATASFDGTNHVADMRTGRLVALVNFNPAVPRLAVERKGLLE